MIINYADPGTTKGTAVATFENSILVGLCLVKSRPIALPPQWAQDLYVSHSWGTPKGGPCLYELPQVYPYGKQSLSRMTAQANDLIAIAARGSAVAQFMAWGQGTGSIKPREWKGQVQKPQHHRKVLQVLSPSEFSLVCSTYVGENTLLDYIDGACRGGPYSSMVTDLLDAVALGLADNGRLRIV